MSASPFTLTTITFSSQLCNHSFSLLPSNLLFFHPIHDHHHQNQTQFLFFSTFETLLISEVPHYFVFGCFFGRKQMTRLFRSKSCGLSGLAEFSTAPPGPFCNNNNEEEEEEEEQEFEEDMALSNPTSTTYTNKEERVDANNKTGGHCHAHGLLFQFSILDILAAALRKSIVTCSVEREDISSSMDISWPTEVRHVSHVTFDRFNGFLGLPTELEPELPRKVPSASASVFGVSAQSMQCTYDDRGNSVPTILLMMQKRLYSGEGLRAEGIFRINAENSQEERVRDQLNKGVVPHGIDVHCLAGLIKAWFRELPTGVLDSLTPEQVMHCNTEDDCTKLVKSLPPTDAALLDWAVNLMADVVQNENYNKMNARNIAMVFAPNMTQMADPLTALIHAVQVMNLLKTLILKTIRERVESLTNSTSLPSCSKFSYTKSLHPLPDSNKGEPSDIRSDTSLIKQPSHGSSPEIDEKLWCSQIKSDDTKSINSGSSTPDRCGMKENEYKGGGYESGGDWLSLRKGVKKLCRHPLFQLNKPAKKTTSLGIVNSNTREGDEEAWA